MANRTPRKSKTRRLPWPSEVARHYYQLNNMIATLYQVTDWLLDDALDIEFCEDLQTQCHRVKEVNRQLWAAKGPDRWGDYVLAVLVAIDEEIPKALDEFEKIGAVEGTTSIRRRRMGRAFRAIARIREALAEVNPPRDTSAAIGVDRQATAQIEQWLELMQIRRHGKSGDDEV